MSRFVADMPPAPSGPVGHSSELKGQSLTSAPCLGKPTLPAGAGRPISGAFTNAGPVDTGVFGDRRWMSLLKWSLGRGAGKGSRGLVTLCTLSSHWKQSREGSAPGWLWGALPSQDSPSLVSAVRWRERGEGLDLAAWAEAHCPPLKASSLTPAEFLMSPGRYFPSSEGSRGTPLGAQCLRLCVPDVLGSSLIPGQGTRS